MMVGKRILKTSLAVFLCITIGRAFGINPFYACIAAVISMESTFTNSYKSGINRMLGTILGATVGLVLSLIRPENSFLAAIGIIIIIYVCNYFKWNKSIVIGCTVFCVIMTNLQGRDPVTYSIFRALDTLLGVVIAIIVNRFIFPPRIWEKFNNEYNEVRKGIYTLCRESLIDNKIVDTKNIRGLSTRLKTDLNLYKEEQGYFKKFDKEKVQCYYEFINNINEVILYIEIINDFKGKRNLNEENSKKINEIYCDLNLIKLPSNEKCEEDEIIFNYHIGKMIFYLNKLK